MPGYGYGYGYRSQRRGILFAGVAIASLLFAAGEQGLHYDISDLSSMYQDAAGTTPAVIGQPVGLVLDKRFGLERGPELVTNGGFDNGLTGWTQNTSATGTATVVDGSLSYAAPHGDYAETKQLNQTVVGKTYEVSYEVKSKINSTTTVTIQYGRTTIYSGPIESLTVGIKTAIVQSSHPDGFSVSVRTDGVIAVDNFTAREVPGNHATQSTTASKPILARHPAGGRRNLLTYTEDFGNAAWINKQISATGVSDPLGGSKAVTLTSTAASQTVLRHSQYATTNATPYTNSIYIRRRTGAGAIQFYSADAAVFDITALVGSEWARIELPDASNAGATGNNGYFLLVLATSGDAVDVAFPQAELGATATPYQKVVSQYDVTEAGVDSLYYLWFDGVDDFLVTGSIDFTSTDEMSVSAGVRKLSDAAQSMMVELSINAGANNGAFYLLNNGTPAYSYLSRGTATSAASGSVVTAPNTAVISGLGEISADTSILRTNGAQVATSASDQGTGNYGNYPLYIGRRGGNNLPFNGNLYSLIVRGKLTAGDDLTKTEEYVAKKTGVTL